MKTERVNFPGWAAFIETVSRPPSQDVQEDGCDQSNQGDKDWTWTSDYAEALRLAMTGWAEGFKAVAVKAETITKSMGGLDLTPRYVEAGDEVDVGLVLAGEPESMLEFTFEQRRKPVVRFVVSAAFSAGVAAESIYNRGAAVLAAIDAIESSGVRVEVELDESVKESDLVIRRRIALKAADDPMDRDKLAFAICHPSTLRRLIFRLHEIEGLARWREMGAGGYGMPAEPEHNAESIIIPAMKWGTEFRSIEEAATFANELIAQAMEQAR